MAPTVDELIDLVRALEAALVVERGHREAAEAHADACEAALSAIHEQAMGAVMRERRKGFSVADWSGLDRRRASRLGRVLVVA